MLFFTPGLHERFVALCGRLLRVTRMHGNGDKRTMTPLRPMYNSTTSGPMTSGNARQRRGVVAPSSRNASQLTVEALLALRTASRAGCEREPMASCDNVPDECERARLIGDITRLLREPQMPAQARTAGLTLIGWLARRMPGESPHTLGVIEARQAEQRSIRKPR